MLKVRPVPLLVALTCLLQVGSGWAGWGSVAADSVSNVTYGGGELLSDPTIYAIFWLPPGDHYAMEPASPNGYQKLIARYFRDVSESSLYAIVSQYGPTSARPLPDTTQLGGLTADTHPYPRNPLLDADIQEELARVATEQGWPVGTGSMFFVFTAAEEQLCQQVDSGCTFQTEPPTCGWHSSFRPEGQPIVYAVLPVAAAIPACLQEEGGQYAPNGNLQADVEVSFVSHEQFEMVTNPIGDGWQDANHKEIADKCQGDYGLAAADGHNVVLRGDPYRIQAEWSNADARCVFTFTADPDTPDPARLPSPTALAMPSATPTATMPTPQSGGVTVAEPATATPQPQATRPVSRRTIVRERCPHGYRVRHGRCRKKR